MMHRKLWLALAVLPVAGLLATPLLGSDVFRSDLRALDDVAVIGSTTPLEVTVSPLLVGGTADLFVVAEGGAPLSLGSFALVEPTFVLDAPVPPVAGDGEVVRYYFRPSGPDGGAHAKSLPALVLLAGGQGTDEPPIWD